MAATDKTPQKIIASWNDDMYRKGGGELLIVRRLRAALGSDELVAKVLVILDTTCLECFDSEVPCERCRWY